MARLLFKGSLKRCKYRVGDSTKTYTSMIVKAGKHVARVPFAGDV